MRQIAIVGLSPDSHEDAPWGNEAWEVWGLPWDAYWHHCDLLFDMHNPTLHAAQVADIKYVPDLEDAGIPIYMQEAYPEVPESVAYPLDEAIAEVGDYFGSSPAYMLALAIMEKVDRIGLWGINLSDSIYDHQRPNMEYLIGFARGRGIECEVHGATALMSHRIMDKFNGKRVIYPQRYGYI